MADDSERPIIIKKVKKGGGHGHHGGAWKVAYADFVTAMMAFFLLMWLLAVTSAEQKEGISDYFSPTSVSSTSGSGSILAGLSLDTVKALRTTSSSPVDPATMEQPEGMDKEDVGAGQQDGSIGEDDGANAAREQERRDFEDLKERIQQALQKVPELRDLNENIIIEVTEEGLRIQLVDQDRRSMFASGSAQMMPYTRQLMALVSDAIRDLPNKIAVDGHTDAVPYRGGDGNYSNWELSADRANATRRELLRNRIVSERIASVRGMADRDPLIKDDPRNAANRRISMTILFSDSKAAKPEETSPLEPIKRGVF
jgi:chemotaxis protein MotB